MLTSYMAVATLIPCCLIAVFAIFTATYVFGVLRAAKKIHALFIDAILGTTMHWLDRTPVSRVITRCTQDIKSIDGDFADRFRWLGGYSLPISLDGLLMHPSHHQWTDDRVAERYCARDTCCYRSWRYHLSGWRLGGRCIHEGATPRKEGDE